MSLYNILYKYNKTKTHIININKLIN